MPLLHVCNTFFEQELEKQGAQPLVSWFRAHPVILQLQFLPLLYASAEDKIAVSDLPENFDSRLCLLENPPSGYTLESWGPSRAIALWAEEHQISCPKPDWLLIRTINSKVFSFTHSPKLPGAELLEGGAAIQSWIEKTPGPKVLKTPFGTAGRGHRINPNVKQFYIGPMIGEPWVERVLDFSTQWYQGELLDVTLFETGKQGTYKRTFSGALEPWILEEHLQIARPLVKKIQEMGYESHLGVDAFVYLWQGKKKVHPVVEINARKTMSWVALQTAEKTLSYTSATQGLLPSSLYVGKKRVQFSRNVTKG